MKTPKRALIAFTVQGKGSFPLDMLRYDQCWPERGDDVSEIEERRSYGDGLRNVRLIGVCSTPTVGRWSSFGWQVIKVE